MVQPISLKKLDLEITASEHAHGRKQIALTLQTRHVVILQISLLVQIPPANAPAIAREEHLHIEAIPLEPIRRRPVRNRKRHANAEGLADAERPREVDAAAGIRDVAAAVVAVHGHAAALPARQPEAWVRRRHEAQRQPRVDLRLAARLRVGAAAAEPADRHFEVDRLGDFGDEG